MKKKELRLLAELTLNSRQPISSLAKKIGVSKEVARYQLEQLKKHTITSFHTIINTQTMGYTRYTCFIQLKNISPKQEQKFLLFLKKHAFVTYAGPIIGKWNAAFDILAKNKTQLEKIKKEINKEMKPFIEELLTITQGSEHEFYPTKFFGINKNKKQKTTIKKKITKTDKKILSLLATNSRIEYSILSEKLDLSANAIKYRIKNLEKNNIIQGYTIAINHENLNIQMYNLQLKLTNEFNETLRAYIRNHKQTTYYYRYLDNKQWDVDIGFISHSIKGLREFMIEIKEQFGNQMKINDFYVISEITKEDITPEGIFN